MENVCVRREQPRGFLLITVVGILAVLLTVCIGFLSFARGEVSSVAHLRDKNDAADMCHAAIDYTIAAISQDLFSGTNFDATKYVTNSKGADGQWWYRPYEKNLSTWLPGTDNWKYEPTPAVGPEKEAPWVYLPPEYFPEGGVRGRFAVQVFDPNSVININDWLEDCAPTQCQMAHMIMDAYGDRKLEKYRAFRDNGVTGWSGWSRMCPIRYQEAWRVASRTTRTMHWPTGYFTQSVSNPLSFNWVTSNTTWMGLYGPEYTALKPLIPSDGIPFVINYPQTAQWNFMDSQFYYPTDTPTGTVSNKDPRAGFPTVSGPTATLPGYGANNYNVGELGYHMNGFTLHAYVDPDTGRSPVNVNTCVNSGEMLPMTAYPGSATAGTNGTYTMEAVFNIESLRRLIKVGTFPGAAGMKDAQNPVGFTADDWRKHEELRTKLAYQYQETLCRYFTGTYNHPASRKYPPIGVTNAPSGVTGAASTDYMQTRFPMGVVAFRQKVRADLDTLSAGLPTIVDFDAAGVANIPKGKLDRRVAAACYDNIVPGKPADLASFAAGDPIAELYDAQLGRQEDFDEKYNVYGYHPDNDKLRAMAYYSAGNEFPSETGIVNLKNYKQPRPGVNNPACDLTLRPKGRDIAKTHSTTPGALIPTGLLDPDGDDAPEAMDTPYRQLAFTRDCFSTELTTTTTTFILIVNVQLVDANTVNANPGDPTKHRDVFWNQWAVVVELAPDVMVESNTEQYYATGRPAYYKTAVSGRDSMDANCRGTLWARNLGHTPEEHLVSTVVKEWKADFRGIKPAQTASFYSGANQTKKRVIIRSISSLNAGMMR
jgi:hypothetical protein